jgi:hypothetical protein
VNSPTGFQARNYAGIIDPTLLAGHRTQARQRSYQKAMARLIAAHRCEFDAMRAEEFEQMDGEFFRRLEATARKVARERGAA